MSQPADIFGPECFLRFHERGYDYISALGEQWSRARISPPNSRHLPDEYASGELITAVITPLSAAHVGHVALYAATCAWFNNEVTRPSSFREYVYDRPR